MLKNVEFLTCSNYRALSNIVQAFLKEGRSPEGRTYASDLATRRSQLPSFPTTRRVNTHETSPKTADETAEEELAQKLEVTTQDITKRSSVPATSRDKANTLFWKWCISQSEVKKEVPNATVWRV